MLKNLFSFCRHLVIFSVLLSLLAGASTSFAQSAFSLRINSVQVIEDTDALTLNTYFTIYDSVSGDVITNARVNEAQILFVDTQTKAPATIMQPNTPFYIALVLDTSGSMGGAAAAMRAAALEAIKSPPEGARFAIMTFNDKFDVVQGFLDIKNTDPLERAIAKVQPVPNAGTCLYDAAYSAIAELEQAPAGRRALILFTDGKDQTQKLDEQCSKHSYEDIIQYATRPDINVPISTIGMAGKQNAINSTELKNMAVTTGGASVIGTQENLGELFKKIMNTLKSQWLAQTKMYPTKGTHNVMLQVKLDDGSIISETLSFTASKNFTAPPEPLAIGLAGISYKSEQAGYQLDLNVTSPQLIQSLAVSVWDKKSGLKVLENEYQNVPAKASYSIPAANFTSGGDYEVRLIPTGSDGQQILNAEGKSPFLTIPFKHNIASSLSIEQVKFEEKDLLATLAVENPQSIDHYEAWLVNEETKVQVQGSELVVPKLENGSTLRAPMKEIPAGKYTLNIRAMDKSNKALSAVDYQGIVYTPPKGPGLMTRVVNGLVKSPLILGSVVLILLLVVGFLVIGSIRNRTMTATPILQANMTTKKKQPGAGDLPVNQTQIFSRKDLPLTNPAVTRQQTLAAPLPLPQAALRITTSADPEWTGKTCTVTHLPFAIGRQGCDLNIENDRSISHVHAKISYDERTRTFMITDLSRNGVLLGGERIPKETAIRLQPGASIGLGPNTTAIFEVK